MNRLRMTLIYEFDYTGELDQAAIDRLASNFYQDPSSFIADPEWDEIILVDVQDITDEVVEADLV